jgi:hypothetical protein
MSKFKIILTNEITDLNLEFLVRDSNIADRWYQELQKNYPLHEKNRFSNWNSNNKTLINELNEQINIINNYQHIITAEVKESFNQQDLNYLHIFFEKLRGEVFAKSSWYKDSPLHVKDALEKFNVLIHQLESSLRTKNKHPTVVVTFQNSKKLKLKQDDYKYFTYKWTSGTVYINYCQVGKTILDVFKDRDSIKEGVRPQIYYSADFMIKFGPSTNIITYFIKSILLNRWIKRQNFKFDNLSLGMIPVADLITNISKEELLKFTQVKQVECIK